MIYNPMLDGHAFSHIIYDSTSGLAFVEQLRYTSCRYS